jgi:hypothetical protein
LVYVISESDLFTFFRSIQQVQQSLMASATRPTTTATPTTTTPSMVDEDIEDGVDHGRMMDTFSMVK